MLHSHMDIVDPGDVTRWRHAPFAGELEDGCLWGRGAVDDKGSLMAMVYAVGLLREAGLRPAGEVLLAAVCERGERRSGHALSVAQNTAGDGASAGMTLLLV